MAKVTSQMENIVNKTEYIELSQNVSGLKGQFESEMDLIQTAVREFKDKHTEIVKKFAVLTTQIEGGGDLTSVFTGSPVKL